ncbi:MAG: hypothetical protein F6K42_31345, partial [Leptolyngbya sp. SIO1D8]|nr:hypothetical protein [Leptolyngbya sp. SIO1D8]
QPVKLLVLTDQPDSLPASNTGAIAHCPHGCSMPHLAQMIHTLKTGAPSSTPQPTTTQNPHPRNPVVAS